MNLDTLTTFIDSNIVIDHILQKGLNVVSSGIIEEIGRPQSDHKPIWAIIE